MDLIPVVGDPSLGSVWLCSSGVWGHWAPTTHYLVFPDVRALHAEEHSWSPDPEPGRPGGPRPLSGAPAHSSGETACGSVAFLFGADSKYDQKLATSHLCTPAVLIHIALTASLGCCALLPP